MADKKSDADYEKLGRMLQSIYESGYASRRRFYKLSFIGGLARGAGGVIGATLVIAALIWVLSLLSDVPLVERIAKPIQNAIENGR